MLQARALTKRFGGLIALDGVSLSVVANEMLGIVGPNGAGKTTLFNLLTGQLMPDAGSVELLGQDITRLRPHRRARLGLARTYQNLRLFDDLSVLENVLVALHRQQPRPLMDSLLGLPRARAAETRLYEAAETLLDRVGLTARRNDSPADLPLGDRKRLDIARALALRPRLLLLDEPAAGMTPPETAALAALLRQLRVSDLTMVVIEHNVGFVRRIADRVIVLSEGRILAEGDPAAVFSQTEVMNVYLGAARA